MAHLTGFRPELISCGGFICSAVALRSALSACGVGVVAQKPQSVVLIKYSERVLPNEIPLARACHKTILQAKRATQGSHTRTGAHHLLHLGPPLIRTCGQ